MNNDNDIKSRTTVKKLGIFVSIALVIIILFARYATDDEFRYKIESNLFKRQVTEATLKHIEINSDDNPSIFAYDKYIAVLSKNTLTQYTSDGNIDSKLDMNISIPLTATAGKYMVMAEKDGERIYLVSGSNILWQGNVDGSISRVNVNKNGYVSVIMKSTIYKSVVVFYDLNGKEVFRRYLQSNYAICTDISTNNKYLAIGEVDYSGTIIKSYVEIVSVDLAQTDAEKSIIYTYEADNGEIITGISYNDKENAVCMFNSYIQKVGINSNERMYDYTNNDVFVDINLGDYYAIIDKQSSGLFSYEYEIKIKNKKTKSENLYILDSDLPKSLRVCNDKMALNLGNEVRIVDTKAWLIKRYTSDKQINKVVLGDTIAGVIYKNKIEIIEL